MSLVMEEPTRPSLTSVSDPGTETAPRPTVAAPRPRGEAARGSFWSRHKTMINFWLDVALAGLFLLLAWLMIVVHLVFPRAAGDEWRIAGFTETDFRNGQFGVFCLFSLGIVVHVMFHWDWICGVVATRLLKRKAEKDDGTLTLIGVGVLIAAIHLVIVGVMLARWLLVRAT